MTLVLRTCEWGNVKCGDRAVTKVMIDIGEIWVCPQHLDLYEKTAPTVRFLLSVMSGLR